MEESTAGNGTTGEDQPQDPAASALEGGDPSQESAASQLTDEQREQAESNATQGQQGEVPSQDAQPTGAFDPDAPVRNAPPSPDETRQAAEEGRLQAPDASGERAPLDREGATPEAGEPAE